MRFYTTVFIKTLFFLIIFISCKSTHVSTNNITASVLNDTTQSYADTIATSNTKETQRIKLEFSETLLQSPDSILDINLYKFLSSNIGKKCFGEKNPDYNCESFLQLLLKEVYNIEIPNTIEEQMKSKSIALFKDSSVLKRGDLLFFNYSAKQLDKISHAGFYLQNGFFVIATYNKGVVVTKFRNGYWEKRFVAAGRIVNGK